MKTKLILYISCIFLFIFCSSINAQNNTGVVSGIISDDQKSDPLPFASVAIFHAKDSTLLNGDITDINGHFSIGSLPFGNYYLNITYIGYNNLKSEVFSLSAAQPIKNFGKIKLSPSLLNLKEITVAEKQIRVEQKGDTIQYNSSAYKVNPDASAEDLISKMPGITKDNNGNVTAHSEQVKQVLVDGKPFFGDDPNMALKNLPADVIDKIQVFDKLSDQAQLTGFDDGQSQKTINIITKSGMSKGQFGKIYAGYGTDDRYIAGGNVNLIKGNSRISIIGLTNNVNQQNFSSQDLLGVTGGNSGAQGRGGSSDRGGSKGGSSNNFLVGNQNGLTTTNSLGLNYGDNWGKKIKVSGSYFFNNTNNSNSTILTRNYFTAKDNGLLYNESELSKSNNFNHRFNFRFEYEIDSSNKIIFTPKFNLQQNNSSSSLLGSNMLPENVLESKTENNNNADNKGYTLSNSLLYQHKFDKRGRTFSINVSTDNNNKTGNGNLYSLSQYVSDTTLIDQHSFQDNNGYSLSSSINYTEPLDSSSQLQFSYSPSYSNTNTDKETQNFNMVSQKYSLLDTALSNKYQSTYISNRGGISYRRNEKKYDFMTGLNFQYATLAGTEIFPLAFEVDKSFSKILPQAMFNYKFSKEANLRIMYRTSTSTPSISQLQNVVNNTNPLLLSTGNPDLKEDYKHTLTARYGNTNNTKATGLFVFLYGNYGLNYIGNSTFIATNDTTLENGIFLKKGSQLTKPVNLDGNWNARSMVTYVLPVSKIKSNLNFNAGFTYNRIPALINGTPNLANNYNFRGGTGLVSNISENLDFTLSYDANYSIVDNSLQEQANNNYFSHKASLKFNWIFWKGFVLNTNMTQTIYNGLSQSYNQNYLLWNTSLGYKFLKNQALDVKVSCFDILNQNKNITRNVTDTYIEDVQTTVLNRYFLLTLTYNLKNFKSSSVPKKRYSK